MEATELVLALDQGGQSGRALAFDPDGVLVAQARREVGESRPRPGHVEQDPEELVASLLDSAREVARALGPRVDDLVGCGLATQRSSIVCWDERTGAALSPVLSWQDLRAGLPDGLDAESTHRRTGLFPSPHYGAGKIRWCLDHLPEVARARAEGRLVCGPLASFLAARLTGAARGVADPANAGRTLLWSLAGMDWDDGMLALFDVPRGVLPPCAPTVGQHGRVVLERRALPLRAVNGDQSAALYARGAPRDDCAYVNVGTGAFVQRRIDGRARIGEFPRNPVSVVCSQEESSVTVVEGTVNGAASALRWAQERLALPDLQRELPSWLAREQDPPLFLNGVSGLGSPFWVPDFESVFVGQGTPAARAVAVLESIVFLLQTNLERLRAPRDLPRLERIVLTGGLARLDGFCCRLAAVTGLAVHRPEEVEATARGIAFLAGGAPQGFARAGDERVFRPDEAPAGVGERYRRWRAALARSLGS